MLITMRELFSSDALTTMFITVWAQLMGAPVYSKAISRATKKAIKAEISDMLDAAKDGYSSYDVDMNGVTDRVWESITSDERDMLGDEYTVQDNIFSAFRRVRDIIWCYDATKQIDTDDIW